jgi:nucleoside-diphosphate-sugar epimerase
MKIALFGGSGFVGSCLLKELEKRNFEILEISRLPISRNAIAADIFKREELDKITGLFDAVIICSSKLPISKYEAEDIHHFVDTNIVGINNILIWSKQRNVSKIIYCSTLSFLPSSSGFTDEVVLLDVGNHYMYKVSKAASEHFVMGFCGNEGIDFCVLRIASVYGVGMKKDILYNFTSKIKSGEKIVLQTSNVTADFIHVEDVVRVIIKCLEVEVKNQIINVASTDPIKLIELISLLGQLLNMKLPEVEVLSTKQIENKLYSVKKMNGLVGDTIPLSLGLQQLINSW